MNNWVTRVDTIKVKKSGSGLDFGHKDKGRRQ